MAVASAQVDVADTPVDLSGVQTDHISGSSVLVTVPSDASESVFVGGSDVDTSNGFELAAGASVTLSLDQGESLYGVCATGPVTVSVLKSGA